jgi:hypothetical protein
MDFIKKHWHDMGTIALAALPLFHPIDPKIYAAILSVLGGFGIYATKSSN